MSLDIDHIRKDFPILSEKIYGKPLVYLDNAATTQKPSQVIDAIRNYYLHTNSNIHRGVHYLSQKATGEFEKVRERVQRFINAGHSHEIIFSHGTTGSINLVASSFAERYIKSGDEIIISGLEHHSNIVPWQMTCKKYGAALKVIPLRGNGELNLDQYERLLNSRTRIVAVTHISNALGIVNPLKEIIEKAHHYEVPVLVDGAQAVPHTAVDVQDLDCDFYCFSSHKIYGPMGTGVLYGKEKYLEELPPYQSGGEMIQNVTFEHTTYNELPFKFEAGTPNVADVIGMGAAINYLDNLGMDSIEHYEDQLYHYALEQLKKIENIKVFGETDDNKGVISFLIGDIHPYDAGTIIDRFGIAVRTGNHCAQPVIDYFGIPGTIRASFGLYNTKEEVDSLAEAVLKTKSMFGS